MNGIATAVVDPGTYPVGTPVEVANGFIASWSSGFEVAEVVQGEGYVVRRVSDGTILPAVFATGRVRPRGHLPLLSSASTSSSLEKSNSKR